MRLDRNLRQRGHDPYSVRQKYPKGTYCPECQAVYCRGSWSWDSEDSPKEEAHLCPACRRMQDDFPAGEVVVSGSYMQKHGSEIHNLIRSIISREEERSPLRRMMDFSVEGDTFCVRLTDDHLSRHIGEALHRAYSGELEMDYPLETRFVRLHWHRDI